MKPCQGTTVFFGNSIDEDLTVLGTFEDIVAFEFHIWCDPCKFLQLCHAPANGEVR
jgi:hypothetical protein